MRIDGTTLTDLEVFTARGGADGLFALLYHTRTGAGRRELRRRIEAPMVDVGEIRGVQDAVDYLAALERPIRLDTAVLAGAESYLGSRIERSRSSRALRWVQEIWLRLRYRDVAAELREGLDSIRLVCASIRSVLPHLRSTAAPPPLVDLGERLERCVRVVGPALDTWSLVGADEVVRGESGEVIADAVEALADLDALQALAIASQRPGWTRPELVESEEFLLEVEGAFHPFVSDAVPNPVRLNGGEPLVFLTGPNMAGKTTYLRTVALVVLLAQIGARVPARAARLAPVDALLTSLNPADNLRAGVSYFYAEVLRVKEAATLLADGHRALILFDEVFKGTNVRDALDASSQVIEGFARSRLSGSIFASHLSELAETLGENPAIRLCRFDGHVSEGEPTFTFQLEPGVSDKRFGMLLLRQAEVPQLIAQIRS